MDSQEKELAAGDFVMDEKTLEDPKLQDALKELLLASDGFRRAYEMWSHSPEPEVSWERTLLDEAQTRLDLARDRVNAVEMTLRDEWEPRAPGRLRP